MSEIELDTSIVKSRFEDFCQHIDLFDKSYSLLIQNTNVFAKEYMRYSKETQKIASKLKNKIISEEIFILQMTELEINLFKNLCDLERYIKYLVENGIKLPM